MNRPWELTIDNSYEEGYALGLQEARAQVIKYNHYSMVLSLVKYH